ncbi:hypothetical protein OH738_33230 [Streptomyces hirsutus]|uniref:Uncharacterized protein n=1 Tax=Streptomyces hirsutus TaxID=35620 RepID=A0ABZ1GJH0_9ACTN|nr:hypothetical protein [Streptomyces hirsutus]WSD05436.1 hypothetical protein OIE73_06455 [Streptomyces hirsutus]WTD21142.1 hypothetical protein OH738_33230 [Streptomyces hirsutus]
MRNPPGAGVGSRLRALLITTSTRKPPAAMVLILLVLLPTALLLGWWGIEDLSEALTYTGRITGAILILVSALSLLGAAAVVDHWGRGNFPYSGMVALIGTVAAFLANIMLLLETFRDGDSTLYRVLFSLLTAGSAWAVVTVWRTSVVIPSPKRVAAALIVSSGLAVANFSYEHLYQPSQRGVRPLVKIAVGKPVLSKDRKEFAVPVDIRIENHSDMGFFVLGTEFHAMGERVSLSQTDRPREQWRADAETFGNFQVQHPLSRREIYQPGQLVLAQPWVPAGYWVEANDEFVTQTVVQLPIDTPYDQLALYASAYLARKDRIGLERIQMNGYSWGGGKVPQWLKEDKNLDSVVYRGRVYENNAIDRHTMDPRYVTVYWWFGTHGAGLAGSIMRNGEENRILSGAEIREMLSRYGLVTPETGPIKRTLWNIKNQR